MATTLNDVLTFIINSSLSREDHNQIIEALNFQARTKRAEARQGLRAGMKVTFVSTRTGRHVVGVIQKVNRVNIDVIEEGNGIKWRVSPGLLKPV